MKCYYTGVKGRADDLKSIDSMIDFFLFDRGREVKVNNAVQTAFLLDANDRPGEYADKIIFLKQMVKAGDIIDAEGEKYIVNGQVDKNANSFSGRLRCLNHRVAFNFTGNVKWFDILIETVIMDIQSNQFISYPTGKIRVTLQENAETRDISVGMRFINTGRAWKVTGLDRSQPGLLKLFCDLDSVSSNDDMVNGIANRWQYETTHNYILAIGNGSFMNVALNDIGQLSVTVTDNGSLMNPLPALIFRTTDQTVASVDNTGKIMGINPGVATVTCSMTYKPTVSDTIEVTVTENITHLYTVSITGGTTIKTNRSQSYVAKIFDNGNEVFDKSVVWSIRNQDGTGTLYANISGATGNSVTVTAGSSYNKYVILKATLADDATVFSEFTIKVISLI